jgi:hypothetical protein
MHARLTILLPALAVLPGCTAFSSVRSAEVHPGLSLSAQASTTTPPGEEAHWFWSLDCYRCNDPVIGLDVELTHGTRRADGSGGNEVSAGFNGLSPFVGGYVQLGKSERSAYGVGGRVGLPFVISWSTSQIYARYDRILPSGDRLLLSPAVMLHAGNSPNGENPGYFVGLVQGIGMELEGTNVSFIPAASGVLGYGNRSSYGQSEGPFATTFATASVKVIFHRRRTPPPPAPADSGRLTLTVP